MPRQIIPTSLLVLLLAAILFDARPLAADAGHRETARGDLGRTDLDLLQGKWTLLEFAHHGVQWVNKADPAQTVGELEFERNKYHLKLSVFGSEVDADYKITLYPKQDPKAFDVVIPDGRVIHGIYDLDGDTLRRAYSPPGLERPKKFQAAGQTFQKWRRVKTHHTAAKRK